MQHLLFVMHYTYNRTCKIYWLWSLQLTLAVACAGKPNRPLVVISNSPLTQCSSIMFSWVRDSTNSVLLNQWTYRKINVKFFIKTNVNLSLCRAGWRTGLEIKYSFTPLGTTRKYVVRFTSRLLYLWYPLNRRRREYHSRSRYSWDRKKMFHLLEEENLRILLPRPTLPLCLT
jgi:hypothetical protein